MSAFVDLDFEDQKNELRDMKSLTQEHIASEWLVQTDSLCPPAPNYMIKS